MLFAALGWMTAGAQSIPVTRATSFDGHQVSLPHDLPEKANVLILGFGRHSADATMPWERSVRTQWVKSETIGFYEIAMLAEVPGLVRPLVVRAIRHQVPAALQPNFLALAENEDAWKRAAGYAPDRPDAAYVLLVDKVGRVTWSTHAAWTPAGFADLKERAGGLLGQAP